MGWLSRRTVRHGKALRHALQSIRRARGLTAEQAAGAMHMSLRSYQRFENGENRLNIDHVLRFCEAADCDPAALIAAVLLNRPELARRCADNKMALLALFALEDINERLGDDLTRIEPRAVIDAMAMVFDQLIEERRIQQEALEQMRDRLSRD